MLRAVRAGGLRLERQRQLRPPLPRECGSWPAGGLAAWGWVLGGRPHAPDRLGAKPPQQPRGPALGATPTPACGGASCVAQGQQGAEPARSWGSEDPGELSLPGVLLAEAQCTLWKPQAGDRHTDAGPVPAGGGLPWGRALTLWAWASRQPGESWSPPGNHCVTYECEKQQDGLVVVTTRKACPSLSCPAVSPGSHLPSLAQCGRGWWGLGVAGPAAGRARWQGRHSPAHAGRARPSSARRPRHPVPGSLSHREWHPLCWHRSRLGRARMAAAGSVPSPSCRTVSGRPGGKGGSGRFGRR